MNQQLPSKSVILEKLLKTLTECFNLTPTWDHSCGSRMADGEQSDELNVICLLSGHDLVILTNCGHFWSNNSGCWEVLLASCLESDDVKCVHSLISNLDKHPAWLCEMLIYPLISSSRAQETWRMEPGVLLVACYWFLLKLSHDTKWVKEIKLQPLVYRVSLLKAQR